VDAMDIDWSLALQMVCVCSLWSVCSSTWVIALTSCWSLMKLLDDQ